MIFLLVNGVFCPIILLLDLNTILKILIKKQKANGKLTTLYNKLGQVVYSMGPIQLLLSSWAPLFILFQILITPFLTVFSSFIVKLLYFSLKNKGAIFNSTGKHKISNLSIYIYIHRATNLLLTFIHIYIHISVCIFKCSCLQTDLCNHRQVIIVIFLRRRPGRQIAAAYLKVRMNDLKFEIIIVGGRNLIINNRRDYKLAKN